MPHLKFDELNNAMIFDRKAILFDVFSFRIMHVIGVAYYGIWLKVIALFFTIDPRTAGILTYRI